MQKTILLTGATDGIGLETARRLVMAGHRVLVHGRNAEKLERVAAELEALTGDGTTETYQADLSRMNEVEALAESVRASHAKLDALVNNAGVFHASDPTTEQGVDVRFVVNTFAPYLLMKRLLPILDGTARVVNLSSAAQSPVSLDALAVKAPLSERAAYAQSKLALTMWSCQLGRERQADEPIMVAVNPGSLLATKMVKDAFGIDGSDVGIGADILVRAVLSDEFADSSGLYYDNDARQFGPPYQDALDPKKCEELIDVMDRVLSFGS